MCDVSFTPVLCVRARSDGPHSLIFTNTNNATDMANTAAWAQVLLDYNIVTNALNRTYTVTPQTTGVTTTYDQVTLFNSTGYYIKQIPSEVADSALMFVMVVNTVLGLDNAVQNAAVKADLEWISAQADTASDKDTVVYVLGHYPDTMKAFLRLPFVASYSHLIGGAFAGHVHTATSTSDLYTQLPAVSQGGTNDNAFMVATLQPAKGMDGLVVNLTIEENVVRWQPDGDAQEPDAEGWLCCG